MVLFVCLLPVAGLMYRLLAASRDEESRAREDREQMEYLRRYAERRKK